MGNQETKSAFILKVALQTSFVGFLLYAIFYAVISVKLLYPAIITAVSFMVVDVVLYILYLRKHIRLVKHLFLFTHVISASVLAFFLLGPESGIHFLFLALSFLPLIFLTYRKFISWLVYLLINLFLFIWAEVYLENLGFTYLLPENVLVPFKIVTICFSLMLISFAIWVIYVANQKSESELSEQAMELEEQADELAQQLKVVEQQQALLEKANATKDKFFSIIAHDLKNPTHNLLGFAELLATKFDSLEPEKAKAYSHMIYEASESINDLINNLLQWSRTQRGKIEIKPDSFSVTELLTKNMNLQKLAADQKSIRLEISCPADLSAYADFNMMDTVVRNLLSNAIKFTPDDGIIQLSGKKEGKNAVLSISDTGRGMDAEEVSRLFRIDNTFSKEGTAGEKGTGLGLIIVQEFIAKNNGQISVKSEKNRGSTFTINLPGSEAV